MPSQPPFIIWTRQRTASIALMDGLASISDRPMAESEPFDGSVEERQFSYIAGDPVLWLPGLHTICKYGWCLKHVYDRLSPEFNGALVRATTFHGYRHIHLTRINEFARLVSLGIAENEIVWIAGRNTRDTFKRITDGEQEMKPLDVGSLLARSRAAEAQWSAIHPHLPNLLRVWTEDLASPHLRHQTLETILRHLEIPTSRLAALHKALLHTNQNTPSLWHLVPNLEELRRAYETAGLPT